MTNSGRSAAKRKGLLLVLLLALALTVALICRSCAAQKPDLRTQKGRESYLLSFGWTVDPDSEEHKTVRIPEQLSGVLREYNELQLEQGFDLSGHLGESCEQYTYTVTNYPDSDITVLITLYLQGREPIAGDVHSTSLNGFMQGLQRSDESD